MKRALVTGGCGFVGRHFVSRLLSDGWHVTVVDDMSTGIHPSEWVFKAAVNPDYWWNYCNGGRFYGEDFRRWCGNSKSWPMPDEFDLIIHCAAVVGGRLKIDGDPLAVATDLAIDSDFWNWVIKAKNKPKIIYFSSSAVYPIELQKFYNRVKLQEDFAARFEMSRIGVPDMTYGWAKLTGELLAQHAVKTYGADVVIYRPFSGYGEDQSFDYPFPSIIRRVVNRDPSRSPQDPITIWGSGDQCRDFIHIDDVVEAVMQTKDVLKLGEVLNLGTGIPTSFRGLVSLAQEEFRRPDGLLLGGTESQIVCDTAKPEGVFYRVADTYKLNQFYKPKVSLEEGIRRVAAHLTKAKETV